MLDGISFRRGVKSPFGIENQKQKTKTKNKKQEEKTMKKNEMKAIMKAWEARNQKVNTRAKAFSVEASIENEIAYEEDVALFKELTADGYLKTGYYNPYNDLSIMR